MTTLLKAMADRKISIYAVAKALGGDPKSTTGNLVKKMKGMRSITLIELTRYCEIISNLSGKPVSSKQISFSVERIILE